MTGRRRKNRRDPDDAPSHRTRRLPAELEKANPEVQTSGTPPGSPPWPGEGRVCFEWLRGRAFLIQRWSVDLPEAPDGIAIIGVGNERDHFRQYYFDSRSISPIAVSAGSPARQCTVRSSVAASGRQENAEVRYREGHHVGDRDLHDGAGRGVATDHNIKLIDGE
jgi:hypothetical protein